MAKSERRAQATKGFDRVRRVQGLRSSGAAGVHANQGEYQRMSRHDIWNEAAEQLEDWDYSYDSEW